MMGTLRRWLHEPRVRDIDVDDNALLSLHGAILRGKPMLRSAFETFYRDMARLCDRHFRVDGLEVELGSGAGFFKEVRPRLITSDIRDAAHLDMRLDAQAMSLDDASTRCVYAINVFHHLPDPERFFSELARVLRPGGGCILIEPHAGFASALLHKHLHNDEHFDPNATGWRTSEIAGPLSGANQAMAHIVFTRDLARFQRFYAGRLELVERGYELNGLRYLLSGGLNFRQLLPNFMSWPLALLERLAYPFARYWTLHQVIVLRKPECSTNT
jgi:SAM-dependent methyltransferase